MVLSPFMNFWSIENTVYLTYPIYSIKKIKYQKRKMKLEKRPVFIQKTGDGA